MNNDKIIVGYGGKVIGVTNSAGVRFKAKPVVGSVDTSLKIDLHEEWKKVPLSRHIEQNNKIEFSDGVVDTKKQKHAIDEYFNKLAKEQRERIGDTAEEIELSDVAIERLIDDLDLSRAFSNDLRFSIEKAQQHAKEVAQAEKVEKYKRDLLNSREARFYKRFRELGVTHKDAARLAWGES